MSSFLTIFNPGAIFERRDSSIARFLAGAIASICFSEPAARNRWAQFSRKIILGAKNLR